MVANNHTPIKFPLQRAGAPAAASFDHFTFSNFWLATHPQPELPIHGQAAYLVDLDTRMVMWSRDPETMRAPASLTKLITAMVAVDDAGSLDRTVEVTLGATQVIPSVMGLSPGEHLTVRQLLAHQAAQEDLTRRRAVADDVAKVHHPRPAQCGEHDVVKNRAGGHVRALNREVALLAFSRPRLSWPCQDVAGVAASAVCVPVKPLFVNSANAFSVGRKEFLMPTRFILLLSMLI